MVFSQRDEESVILEHLQGDGTYLDIGSYDGKTFSNVRALAEKGWRGICVEPAAHPFAAMLDDPPPGAKLVHAAIGPRTGLVSFLETKDALSTTSRAHARKWGQYASFTPAYTVSITIHDLLKEFPGPHRLVSIDTEGTSMWLFKEMAPLFDEIGTEMVVVEHDGEGVHLDGWERVYGSVENVILKRR